MWKSWWLAELRSHYCLLLLTDSRWTDYTFLDKVVWNVQSQELILAHYVPVQLNYTCYKALTASAYSCTETANETEPSFSKSLNFSFFFYYIYEFYTIGRDDIRIGRSGGSSHRLKAESLLSHNPGFAVLFHLCKHVQFV